MVELILQTLSCPRIRQHFPSQCQAILIKRYSFTSRKTRTQNNVLRNSKSKTLGFGSWQPSLSISPLEFRNVVALYKLAETLFLSDKYSQVLSKPFKLKWELISVRSINTFTTILGLRYGHGRWKRGATWCTWMTSGFLHYASNNSTTWVHVWLWHLTFTFDVNLREFPRLLPPPLAWP